MKKLSIIILLFSSFVLEQISFADSSSLPRSTPESQGIASTAIQAFVEAADKEIDTMHSFMLVRHGKVVAECWWDPESADKPHILWSLSKSFASTAVGLAQAEGKLDIDDKVAKYFPEDLPKDASCNLKEMRIRDLLTMSTGHDPVPRLKGEEVVWTKQFFQKPAPHTPGTVFRYNTAATYMQSALVQKVTGEKIVDYLQPRLFDPLGIDPPKWDESPQGISIGGYGLYLKTEDIAKFGQLFLQKGKWKGKQLVPSEWVEEATSKQVENDQRNPDWHQGYGYQFWQCRHGAYRGDGRAGQFCVVLPKQDAVVIMTADNRNLQGQLNLVWKHLLPAFQDKALSEDPKAHDQLKKLIKNLKASH